MVIESNNKNAKIVHRYIAFNNRRDEAKKIIEAKITEFANDKSKIIKISYSIKPQKSKLETSQVWTGTFKIENNLKDKSKEIMGVIDKKLKTSKWIKIDLENEHGKVFTIKIEGKKRICSLSSPIMGKIVTSVFCPKNSQAVTTHVSQSQSIRAKSTTSKNNDGISSTEQAISEIPQKVHLSNVDENIDKTKEKKFSKDDILDVIYRKNIKLTKLEKETFKSTLYENNIEEINNIKKEVKELFDKVLTDLGFSVNPKNKRSCEEKDEVVKLFSKELDSNDELKDSLSQLHIKLIPKSINNVPESSFKTKSSAQDDQFNPSTVQSTTNSDLKKDDYQFVDTKNNAKKLVEVSDISMIGLGDGSSFHVSAGSESEVELGAKDEFKMDDIMDIVCRDFLGYDSKQIELNIEKLNINNDRDQKSLLQKAISDMNTSLGTIFNKICANYESDNADQSNAKQYITEEKDDIVKLILELLDADRAKAMAMDIKVKKGRKTFYKSLETLGIFCYKRKLIDIETLSDEQDVPDSGNIKTKLQKCIDKNHLSFKQSKTTFSKDDIILIAFQKIFTEDNITYLPKLLTSDDNTEINPKIVKIQQYLDAMFFYSNKFKVGINKSNCKEEVYSKEEKDEIVALMVEKAGKCDKLTECIKKLEDGLNQKNGRVEVSTSCSAKDVPDTGVKEVEKISTIESKTPSDDASMKITTSACKIARAKRREKGEAKGEGFLSISKEEEEILESSEVETYSSSSSHADNASKEVSKTKSILKQDKMSIEIVSDGSNGSDGKEGSNSKNSDKILDGKKKSKDSKPTVLFAEEVTSKRISKNPDDLKLNDSISTQLRY